MSQKINQVLDDYKHSLIDLGTAHQAIISAILEEGMPKEKLPSFAKKLSDNWSLELKLKNQRNCGFNQALSEVHKVLKEIFEIGGEK